MSNWWRQIKPAMFRGVPFHVDTSTRSEGNNTVLREYPFQDLPTIFSMGQAAGEIKFSAYVIGNDYISKANQLEQALLVQDSGVLIHPTIGSIRVWHHGKFNIQEAYTSDGGVARFDLTFIRAEARRYPSQATNTGLAAFAAALQAKLAMVQEFIANYSLDGVAGWVRENVFNQILALHGAVFDIAYAIAQGTDGLADLLGMAQGAQNLLQDIALIPSDLSAHFDRMLKVPKNLTQEQAAYAVAQLLPVDNNASSVQLPNLLPARDPNFESLLDYTVSPAQSPYLTPSRLAESQACAALSTLIQQLAWATLIQVATQMELGNYDVALSIRSAIHEHYLRHIQNISSAPQPSAVGTVDLYSALSEAHAAALNHLHRASLDLSRLINYTPRVTDNIYSLSYQLYGTPQYADEIWAMNPHITNPMLVTAGVALRVVDHD